MSNRCLLSIAMIVKNEENNIRRALESIKDVADEIIVVDTGSMDRTPEIVKEYTDKLYFHEWKNDFSEARNYSLKFPTCEWVMIFDADEEVKEDFKAIKNFLKNLPEDVNTIYIPTISYLDWNFKKTEVASTPRIFRNGTVSYKNIVHNQAVYKPKVVNANFPIYHYGYIWTRKLKEEKYIRTKNLIIKHLEGSRDPLDRLYYLVQLYKTEAVGGKIHKKNEIGWQILDELRKINKVPGIVLEFLYLFGIECIKNEMFDLGKYLFETTIKAYPNNPDPYLGLLILWDRRENGNKAIEIGEEFLDKVEKAQKSIEEFQWTILSFKNIEHAHTILAKWYLRKKNLEKFDYHVKKTIENFKDINSAEKILNILITEIVKNLDQKREFKKILPTLNSIVEYSNSNSLNIDYDSLLFKIAELRVDVSEELINKFKPELPISKYIVQKILDPRKDYLLDFVLGDQSLEDFVEKTGVEGLLFLYDLMLKRDSEINVLKKILKLRNMGNEKINGIVYALLGDLYLKLENFKESISSYRRAIEILPEIATFIKPIVEDLKTRLDKNIDGSYDELVKHFSRSKEILFDFIKYFGERQASKLYLISNDPIAIYLSSVALMNKEPEKSLELLQKIDEEKIDDFPFYYYKLAKLYEKKEGKLDKAFQYHIKACEQNEKLADIRFGKYIYDGFYPSRKPNFFRHFDPIIWVGNISEKFSTLGIIHPVRCWKKGKKFIYCYPFPSDEALKVYQKREKEILKSSFYKVKIENLVRMLSKLDIKDLRVYPESAEKDYEGIFNELDITINHNSRNLLILSGVEQSENISELTKECESVLIFYNVPDLKDREDEVWFYPPFRIFRTTAQLKGELNDLGFKVEIIEVLNKNLRFVFGKRS